MSEKFLTTAGPRIGQFEAGQVSRLPGEAAAAAPPVARERTLGRRQQQDLAQELGRLAAAHEAAVRALQKEATRRAAAETALAELRRRTVAEQEAERGRIARELHDTLGQSLTLLQLGLDAIGRTPPAGEELPQRLAALKTLAADAGREASRLAWEIRPAGLDELGLAAAIRALLESWSEHAGIRCELHLALDGRRLGAAVETTVYRVLQEALTNVLRHAAASRVGVILRREVAQVTLIVEDDGTGLRSGVGPSRRLGLRGMRERLALVGGTLEIESAPGAGTTLFVRIPV